MKIIIAPDSFKESLSSLEVAYCIEEGFKEVYPNAEYLRLPIADGGEGTVEALILATKGTIVKTDVTGPLGNKIKSFYGICGDKETVVIEMAAASGLDLVPVEKRNPLKTTSYGTGELIKAALDSGYRKFIIGIGGSATNDVGAGMLQALGVKLLDVESKEIALGAAHLVSLDKIDINRLDSRIFESEIKVACDVNNPLTGPNGASAIFGPQKGATPQMVKLLDSYLVNFSKITKRDLGKVIDKYPGAGAAGGMGAALKGFFKAQLLPGIDIIIAQTKLKDLIQDTNLVITGEGKIDGQSILGKAPIGIAKVAKEYNIPVIAIAGSLGFDVNKVRDYGINAVFSVITEPCSLEDALKDAKKNIKLTAKNIAEVLKLSKNI